MRNQGDVLAQNDLLLRTHAYLGGILRESDCPSLTIGGTADHVHAFFRHRVPNRWQR